MQKSLITNNVDKTSLFEYLKQKVLDFDFTHSNNITISLAEYIQTQTKNTPEVNIKITPEAYIKTLKIVQTFDKEIAWHGTIEVTDNTYTITDIFLYPQTVTAVTVDADEQKYTDWLISKGDKLNTIRMQGHSHVNMGVSPSTVDLTYYKDMLNQVNDYYIFMIINKKTEVHLRLYDKRTNILYTEIPLQLALADSEFSLAEWSKEQLKQVTEKSTVIKWTQKEQDFYNDWWKKAPDTYDTAYYKEAK